MMNFVSVILSVVACYHVTQAKVTVTKFENCDNNADYPIKMTFKLKQGGDGMQVLEEGSLSTKVPLGNDILDIADVSYKEDNGAYEHLITIKENLCDAVNKYMGEFMHDIQEAAGLERGKCPVPPGDYKIKDHTLDFQKFKFKKIPDGEFLVKVSLLDAKTNETLNCHNLEFTIEK
ncbi:uncharacterized protein LOC103314317 [Tribolium castaneum]|nr:PREDICTED: uncharacterized protein LOC103314317 [Tribolium castaneum]|eukprot:XP_008198252.1 PREDICTED: uncharacterized protein LOC103314317 [Tribolium castaneum]